MTDTASQDTVALDEPARRASSMDLGVVGMVLVVAAGAWLLVRQSILVWKSDPRFRYVHRKPPGCPVSESTWRNVIHAQPMTAGASVLFAATVVIAAIANGPATVVLAALSLVAVLLAYVVFLFNKPTCLVPPACRSDRGWIGEHFGRGGTSRPQRRRA